MSEPNTTDIKTAVIQILAEYEKQRIENSAWNKTKQFISKHFQTILIIALLFYAFGGFKMFENFIGKLFNIQFNTAVIQRIIPDNTDRQSFIERIQKIFARDFTSEEQFESVYRQITADFRYKYPKLKEFAIKNKEQLREFAGIVPVPQAATHYGRAGPQKDEEFLTKLNELTDKVDKLETVKNTEAVEVVKTETETVKEEPETVSNYCSGGACTPVYRSRWRR